MSIKKIGLGGFGISVTATEHEAGLHVSVGGDLWGRFARGMAERRRNRPTAEPAQPLAAPAPDGADAALLARVRGHDWYHTIDLGNGLKTAGAFDHGPILDRYNLPARLDGLRVLDVATYDGFWAFEFERRGAREVLALDLEGPKDLDLPPDERARLTEADRARRFGAGFAIAKEALGLRVERVTCNVYDLSPEKFGTFDVVHSGDVLPHLANPVKALQNIASVCTGYALISDVFFPDLDHQGRRPLMEYRGGRDGPTWWRMGFNALEQMVRDAGFARVSLLSSFTYGYRVRPGRWNHAVFQAFK